jgi:hypothetical protein
LEFINTIWLVEIKAKFSLFINTIWLVEIKEECLLWLLQHDSMTGYGTVQVTLTFLEGEN